ncbi:NAD(P)H-quinone oxidoreductase [Micrococcoides hystricis]|uniref:NAD(P)H-quinone oxidoreductase n=1 Tax=Micrococcoides hystricis TaxID=1572761 RepID=A0ABV6PAW5_9MICC
MRAVKFTGAGGPEVIEIVEVDRPEPAAGEVLIKVAAAGLNRADALQRRGHYPPQPGMSDIPGLEVSGTVVAYGPTPEKGAGRFASKQAQLPLGAEVCALLSGGGYADYVAVPAGQVLEVPEPVSLRAAASLPEVAATVYTNLFFDQRVRPGDRVLIHGGSGGIGSMAIQLLAALQCTVIVTVSSAEKAMYALNLGATHVINYQRQDFAEQVKIMTDGAGVDFILDVVGAKYLQRNVDSLAPFGTMVTIGLQSGARAELDMGSLLRKKLTLRGSTLRDRSLKQKRKIMSQVGANVWPLISEGYVNTYIDRTFDLEDAQAAHEYFDSGQHRGKVLLTMDH